MFNKLGVQLYTIRDYMQDPDFADVAFAKLAEMGYTEAHTAGNAFDAKLFSDLLAKHGISIIGTHYSFEKILNDPEETMEIHRMWGTTNIGIGAMPFDIRTSLDGLKGFIRDYNKAAELHGMRVAEVGKAFLQYEPRNDLYNEDHSHPSAIGSAIAARVIFETVKSWLE